MNRNNKLGCGAMAALILATSGLFATSAQADDSDEIPTVDQTVNSILLEHDSEISPMAASCALGWGCLWQGSNYSGKWAANQYDGFVNTTVSNSAWANGNSCHRTSFRTGSGSTNHFFILDSQTRIGSNYRDPNLSNGAGRGQYSGENWKDRVRYIRFYDGTNCA